MKNIDFQLNKFNLLSISIEGFLLKITLTFKVKKDIKMHYKDAIQFVFSKNQEKERARLKEERKDQKRKKREG